MVMSEDMLCCVVCYEKMVYRMRIVRGNYCVRMTGDDMKVYDMIIITCYYCSHSLHPHYHQHISADCAKHIHYKVVGKCMLIDKR